MDYAEYVILFAPTVVCDQFGRPYLFASPNDAHEYMRGHGLLPDETAAERWGVDRGWPRHSGRYVLIDTGTTQQVLAGWGGDRAVGRDYRDHLAGSRATPDPRETTGPSPTAYPDVY